MKFKILQSLFRKHLEPCARIIGSTTISPILTNVFIEASKKDNIIKIVATNLEVSIGCRIDCDVEDDGHALFNCRILVEFVNSIPASAVISIELSENSQAKITAPGVDATMYAISPEEEFPFMPEVPASEKLCLPSELFRQMIYHTAYIGSGLEQESKPFLNAVCLSFKGKMLTCVSTDSRRLALDETEVPGATFREIDVVVSAKVLQEIQRLLENETGELEIAVSEKLAEFRMPRGISLKSRLREGRYPDYNGVIPKPGQLQTTIKVNKSLLLENIRGTLPVAREVSEAIRMISEGETVTLITESAKVGEIIRNFSVEKQGNDFEITYNARFLIDAVTHVDSEDVAILMSGEKLPLNIVPVSAAEGRRTVNLIMPIKAEA